MKKFKRIRFYSKKYIADYEKHYLSLLYRFKEYEYDKANCLISYRNHVLSIISGEPDEYKFSYKGFLCFIGRHPLYKHLCGYVCFNRLNNRIILDSYNDIQVHGGITYVGKANGVWNNKFRHNDMFIGFDCNHCYDFSPNLSLHYDDDISYKTIDYCIIQCKLMVDQILRNHIDIK